MSETNLWTVAIAAYAAVISTGALFLEVRRWFETGPRVGLSVMPEAIIIGGWEKDPNTYIAITVTNSGTSPTTITHMLVKEFESHWKKIRRDSKFSGLVPQAAPPGRPELPIKLDVGDVWHGQVIYNKDLAQRALNGDLWVGVACSHSRREILRRVEIPAESKLKEKFEIE